MELAAFHLHEPTIPEPNKPWPQVRSLRQLRLRNRRYPSSGLPEELVLSSVLFWQAWPRPTAEASLLQSTVLAWGLGLVLEMLPEPPANNHPMTASLLLTALLGPRSASTRPDHRVHDLHTIRGQMDVEASVLLHNHLLRLVPQPTSTG